jgi:hypothetical protein
MMLLVDIVHPPVLLFTAKEGRDQTAEGGRNKHFYPLLVYAVHERLLIPNPHFIYNPPYLFISAT